MKQRYYVTIDDRRTIFDTLAEAREFALNNTHRQYVEYGVVVKTSNGYVFKSLEIIKW